MLSGRVCSEPADSVTNHLLFLEEDPRVKKQQASWSSLQVLLSWARAQRESGLELAGGPAVAIKVQSKCSHSCKFRKTDGWL